MAKRKVQSEIITGIDIGSTAVRVAVGKIVNLNNSDSELQILAISEVNSEGVNKGNIASIEESVSAISHALEQAERMVGLPIEHAWVSISGTHINSQESKGVVAIAKSDGEIAEEDLERAVNAAKTVATPLNYEILHVLPKSFCVDGQTGIKDPVGMTGVRLEVDTKIIQGQASNIKNITKTVYRTGIDIDDLVFSILACGEAVVSQRQKDLGVAVVNIGGATTSLVVYEEGDIIHAKVLPVGSEHITNDLAIGLRTSIDVAEKLKIDYGHCVPQDINKKELIDLASVGADMKEEVSLRYVAEIIEARMEEILEKVDSELESIGRSGLLPAGVVFTGGGAKISGLIELAKNKLGLPASLGYSLDISGLSEKVGDLSFTTAVGLVKWGANLQSNFRNSIFKASRNVEKVGNKIKSWFKSLVP
ncbi:MAG TPA: cell division protein FtsA [Candidatus Magasanikbacteria bacterium]|nr:cell division protein FtsA [Candidatus Magasanikbacteria bacterium]HQF56894.1 cell division protein FtsA [Candidatus Magasanikbacteria bacterium]